MAPETEPILEQLYEAISGARSYGKTMYVYHADGQWFYSGKLPCDAKDYYIVYPNGETDRSDCVPAFSKEDLTAFAIKTARPPAFVPEGTKAKKFKKPIKLSKNRPPKIEKEENWMPIKKKIFLCYCAFAPFFAAAFALLLFRGAQSVLTIALFCLPQSVFFALVALHRPKNPNKAYIASWLSADSHLLLYGLLWLQVVEPVGYLPYIIMTMFSLLLAGIAVLILWDNDSGEIKDKEKVMA